MGLIGTSPGYMTRLAFMQMMRSISPEISLMIDEAFPSGLRCDDIHNDETLITVLCNIALSCFLNTFEGGEVSMLRDAINEYNARGQFSFLPERKK